MHTVTTGSPHISVSHTVTKIMWQVLFALIPGVICYLFFFGWGVLLQIVIAIVCALCCEAVVLRLRSMPIKSAVCDGSAMISALIFALSISPLTPWWVTCLGIAFAIVVVKHLYGGLGYNLFNPAMSGYLFVLFSFPAQMGRWSASHTDLGLGQILSIIFLGEPWVDQLTGATPLSYMQAQLSMMAMVSEVKVSALFDDFGARGWANLAFLLGGLWLIVKKTIDWRIPLTLLACLLIMSTLFHLIDGDRYADPLFYIFGGSSILCAFFVATDPVSAAITPKGCLLYAAGIGILIYIIRTWAALPDGAAVAVLLMNGLAPLIDRYSKPSVYGRS